MTIISLCSIATEVHTRLRKESATENELEDESKAIKQAIVDEVDISTKQKAHKGKTEPEQAEEKSFWDDIEDGNAKKPIVEEFDDQAPSKAKKSFTEPEIIEEKSFWDENHNENKKQPIIEEVSDEPKSAKKGATKPEIIEEIPIEEDLKSPKRKSIKKQSLDEPLSAEIEGIKILNASSFSLQYRKQLLAANSRFRGLSCMLNSCLLTAQVCLLFRPSFRNCNYVQDCR